MPLVPPVTMIVMRGSIYDHAADALAAVHQVEGLVDPFQRLGVGDHRVDLDLPVHVPVDVLRHIGAAARPAEGRAAPDPAGDELERPRGDLFAGLGHSDDHALAPAAMAGLQRLAHDLGVAGAVEGVVRPTVGERHQVRHEVAVDLPRIDDVGHAEAAAPRLARRVDVDANDHRRAHHLGALDDVEADAAQAEHYDIGAGLDLGGVDDRAYAGGHPAADVAGLVEGGVGADLRHRDLGQHGVVREGRAAHVVEDRLAFVREPAGGVGHQAAPLG